VQRYIEAHGLVERPRKLGDFLAERLETEIDWFVRALQQSIERVFGIL